MAIRNKQGGRANLLSGNVLRDRLTDIQRTVTVSPRELQFGRYPPFRSEGVLRK